MSKKNIIKSLDPREHCLLRPDMYIGSVKNTQTIFYGATVADLEENKENEYKIESQDGLINPGLHRIFIEVISNAIDNVWRSIYTETP